MKAKRIGLNLMVLALATGLLLLAAGLAGAARIKVLDRGYRLVTVAPGTVFSGCNGATIGADGNLYIVHTGNNTVSRVNLKTMKPSVYVSPAAGVFIPDDITADGRGNLYITGTTPFVGEVYRIDKFGRKTVIARGLAAPNGIQFNHKTGRLFITECFQGNRVFELDPRGVKPPRLMIKKNVIPVPEGFGFDRKTNDLIVPDLATGRILRIHPDTAKITVIAKKFITPVALKVGPDNMAYIVELATGRVWRMSLDGKKRQKLAQIVPGLDNLAITKKGRLFVTSYWFATVYEVSTDGSGKFKQLFPGGVNQIAGLVVKNGTVYIADAIMIRALKGNKWVPTKLNAWAVRGLPLTIGLAAGPGGNVFWPDFVHGAVAIGDPVTGKFKAITGGLKAPTGMVMHGAKLLVAEYGAGRVTAVSLKDGKKTVVASGLEGPVALTVIGNKLYVAEIKAGRVSQVDLASGKKQVFLDGAGRPAALGKDAAGNLLVLDGGAGRLLKVGVKKFSISLVAKNLPVTGGTIGSYPPVQLPVPMAVTAKGDVYLATNNRGVIKLEKVK